MSDKRSVSTDALETLGTIIESGGRDAIHLAVEPVKAGMTLYPGQYISAKDGVAMAGGKALGIVDPFLSGAVFEGQMFWLVVFPRKITSLRHVWSHPDFPDNECPSVDRLDRSVSEQWLRDFCDRSACPDYETVMEAALSSSDGEYLHIDGRDASGEIPPEFWTHAEIVTGRKIGPERRASYFSCSC